MSCMPIRVDFSDAVKSGAVDCWLEHFDAGAMRDRRGGSCSRYLLTELGDIELSMPRTRCFCPGAVTARERRRRRA